MTVPPVAAVRASSFSSRVFPAPASPHRRTTWVVAAHQRGPIGGRFGVGGAQGNGLPHADGFLLAFEQDRLALTEPDATACQFRGQPAAEHLSGGGHLLEAGSHVDRVTDHGDVAGGADGSGHHLAGVDADREGQVAPERLDGQAGGDRSLGVVSVGQGHTEDGHHRVAHVLVHRASMLGHDLGQASERRIHDASHNLGIGPLGQ
jgi:hypothetical protein